MARAVALMVFAALAGGGSALGAGSAEKFRLPSGNIYCAYEHYSFSPTDLRCEIKTKIRPKTGACDDGYLMRQTGPARAFCAADTIYDPAAPVLTYGTTRQYGVFRCSSSRAGLKCANASGHGFVLSTLRSYTYREPASQNGSFKTPSRNMVCGYSIAPDGTASLECGIKSGLNPPPARIHCDAGDPNSKRLSLRETGRATPVLCAGDPGPLLPQIEARARVLPYGTDIRIGGIRCDSEFTGLTCRNRGGHGFFLSRERWRLF